MDGSRDVPRIFSGVRFALSGFDSISEAQYRSLLVSGGGTEAGGGDSRCTHVIVFGLLYDDPVCVSARRDGKLLVAESWLDDCLGAGELVDATRVLYRPVRDLNGIPGCERFSICLTGYQRNERDEIMRMVSLMGAEFSKPLVANKVTHLICYKFEGEKYELAKKVNLKLVNHRWLEDCLKSWEVLPVANYTKSSWEMEVLEAEARDSEEETEEDREILKQKIPTFVPSVPHSEGPSTFCSPIKNNVQQGDEEKQPINTEVSIEERLSMPCEGSNPCEAPNTCIRGSSGLNDFAHQYAGYTPQRSHGDTKQHLHKDTESILPSQANSKHNGRALSLTGKFFKSNLSDIAIDEKAAISNFSTMNVNKLDPSRESSRVLQDFAEVNIEKKTFMDRSSPLETCVDKVNNMSAEVSPGKSTHHVESFGTSLPQKRNLLSSRGTPKSLKSGSDDSPHNAQQSTRFIGSNLTTSFPEDIKAHDISHACASFDDASCGIVSLKSTEKPQVIESKSKYFSKKKYLKPGKTPLADNILNITKTAEAKSVDVSLNTDSRERLACETTTIALPLDYESSGAAVPSKCDKLVRDLPLDDQIDAAEMTHSAIEKSTNKSVIGKERSDDIGSVKENAGSSFGGLQVSDLVTGLENHGHALPPKAPCKEPVQPPKTKDDEGLGSETKKLSDKTDDICNEKKTKVSRKKVVSNKKLIGRAKPAIGNNNKDGNDIISNKTPQKEDAKTSRNDGIFGEELGESVKTGTENKPAGLVSHHETYTVDNVLSTKIPLPKKRKNTKASEIPNDGILGEELGESVKTGTEKNQPASLVSHHETYTVDNGLSTKSPLPKKRKNTKASEIPNDYILGEELGKSVKTGTVKNKPASLVSHQETNTVNNVLSTKSPLPKKRKDTKASEIRTNKGKEITADENDQKMNADSGKENRPSDPITITKDYHNKTDLKETNKHKKMLKGSRKENTLEKHPSQCKKSESSEPAWFIFSGHRMQRKEFQTLVRQLKGRLCRDSHQWSYQATHFIVPDPVRRTEKFFAAAASGRWILKTDYLSASNEAGKLLDEEPFEWFWKGLSEDGAISLEAPRKWRELKERTGHGAFYGMKIIIYGDCFVPPLDTLKRAVKAGDGTILATAPPYTRSLKSDVDYAVISTGMLRIDSWVQEFLRHEIPCVMADYLVDHVCKPGYPLDKHVLFNTHAWAEKSFANLSGCLEETVTSSDEA